MDTIESDTERVLLTVSASFLSAGRPGSCNMSRTDQRTQAVSPANKIQNEMVSGQQHV